jgi:hypothetical protein
MVTVDPGHQPLIDPASRAVDRRRDTGDMAMALAIAGVAVAGLGLLARIMTYPLRHDEQMYLPVGALLGKGALYQDYGFNNLPNLPLLVAAVVEVTGTDHYLLTGRLIIFASWVLAAVAMALLVRRATDSRVGAALAVFALVASPPLLGAAGMLVTNNFVPLAFALMGTHLFIAGLDRAQPRFATLLASGACLAIAAGFKANYVFLAPPFAIAALLVPRTMAFPNRAAAVVLPFVLGGIVGALPVLAMAAPDPDGFLAHVLRYHRGPHIAYWRANPDLDGPKILTLGGKAQLAESVWLNGPTLILVVACLYLAFAGGLRSGGAARWPVWLVAGLITGAGVVAFVPTPAFPQYYVAPIPLLIVLAALLFGRLEQRHREATAPFIYAAAVMLLLGGAPRLLANLPDLLAPGRWTVFRVHAAGQDIAAEMQSGGEGRLATLAPIYALEAGRPVYPQLVTGPLVYRVGDLIPQPDRRYYRLISPTTIGQLLEAEPPAGILVGYEGDLDAPFEAFAVRHGYRRVVLPSLKGRDGQGILFIRDRSVPNG